MLCMARPRYRWRLRSRELELGARTLVMGILNVTPDSFSDGGEFLERDRAVAHALRMLDEGADIIDLGGESTRPGAKVGNSGVAAEEEIRRVLPVMKDVLRDASCGVVLMHSRGLPEQWKTQSPSPDIVKEVEEELREWARCAV